MEVTINNKDYHLSEDEICLFTSLFSLDKDVTETETETKPNLNIDEDIWGIILDYSRGRTTIDCTKGDENCMRLLDAAIYLQYEDLINKISKDLGFFINNNSNEYLSEYFGLKNDSKNQNRLRKKLRCFS